MRFWRKKWFTFAKEAPMSVQVIVHAGGKRANCLRYNIPLRKKPGLLTSVAPCNNAHFRSERKG